MAAEESDVRLSTDAETEKAPMLTSDKTQDTVKSPNDPGGDSPEVPRPSAPRPTTTLSSLNPSKTTLSTWVGTWNVGNVAPDMDACTEWLATARGHDLVAVAAQEASYPHSKKNLKPEAVWEQMMIAEGRTGNTDAQATCDETTTTSTSHDSTACQSEGADDENSNSSTFTKKKKGFFTSSKFTRASGAIAGALAGGVAAGPLAPFGLVAGAAAGYYSSAKVAAELKARRHWFEVIRASMGPDYVLVQSTTLLQMRLAVFCKKVLLTETDSLIEEVRVGYQATGVGNLIGNKGGLMVRLELRGGESVVFVACHLAAHEGEKHVSARDESIARILRGVWDNSQVRAVGASGVEDEGSDKPDDVRKKKEIKECTDAKESSPGNDNQLELLACTTHVFVFGDLNYRIDPGMVGVEDTRGNKKLWASMWKKSNDAPSGSVLAAIGGLTAKSAKKKNADEAFASIEKERQGVEPEHDGNADLNATDRPGPALSSSFAATKRWVQGWHLVVDTIKGKDWKKILKGDQLSREIRRGSALNGFREGPIAFPPTFKFAEGDVDGNGAEASTEKEKAYSQKRIPSWCDRVLARSLGVSNTGPNNAETNKSYTSGPLRFLKYTSVPSVRSSDHTPVYASCELDVYDAKASNVESPNIGALRLSGMQKTTKQKLVFRLASFRVTLEEFIDEDEKSDDSDSEDESNYDVPGTPMYRAGSLGKKESMMEKLIASTGTSSNANQESKSQPGTPRNAAIKPPPAATDTSSSAMGVMDKLNKGAVAIAHWRCVPDNVFHDSLNAHKRIDKHFANAAGMMSRPMQPVICENDTDEPDGVHPLLVTSTELHWSVAGLPVFTEVDIDQLDDASDAAISQVLTQINRANVTATVFVEKESAGCAICGTDELVNGFMDAWKTSNINSESSGLMTHKHAFSVPFNWFARRRGKAEGVLVLELVDAGETN